MIKALSHLCCVICVKEKELKRILLNIDSFYYEQRFPKFKKNGDRKCNKDGTPRDRIITPSTKELKAIQKRLNAFFLDNITQAPYSYGGVKKRDNVKNTAVHKGNKYFFQTDLQDFFPFVTSKKIYEALVSNGFSYDVSRIITRLTTYKGHLPQGTSTSSTLANLVFSKDVGTQIHQYAIENGLRFTIFVDDVTLSSPVDFKDKTLIILQMIRTGGFRISHSKTHYRTYPSNLTGVKMGQNFLDVTDAFKNKLAITEGKSKAQIIGELLYARKIYQSNKKDN
jgi:RNA-directed DNA polymerase